jgi:hypothetical protein
MYIYGIGVKGGYYTYMQKDVLFCYSVSMGPALIKYYYTPDSPPKGGFVQKTFFITPNILAALRVNDELRIGLEISYVVMAYHFDPAYTGINQYVVYNPAKDINALTSCAEFGFGVYWAFDEPKH